MKNFKFKFYTSNYLEFYNNNIKPKLCEIDIFIKSNKGKNLKIEDVSKILYISKKEICEILIKNNKKNINTKNFFLIMKNGSSDICKLYKRECEFINNLTYSKNQISYIYNIDINIINFACKKLKINFFSSNSIKILFKEIPVYNIIKNN